eukprot:CAMPEP_0174699312 /NCGR_PEP_ID=MMETSP1094-20130205/4630_1 /TAXON_ID=156173 /ORGANISM="Chrysochromulina brevifilum, Strain UTEX LB 985" /LENGTH=103 /DNA_ID=CAMNT_0015896619 /DNA_START=124 /DNA_END=436 /DNA_ORIENTATION=+
MAMSFTFRVVTINPAADLPTRSGCLSPAVAASALAEGSAPPRGAQLSSLGGARRVKGVSVRCLFAEHQLRQTRNQAFSQGVLMAVIAKRRAVWLAEGPLWSTR